jgi:tRNA A37 threonylcarbamoyladenosine synthetase subunit TsaC/SUA5/YrdC
MARDPRAHAGSASIRPSCWSANAPSIPRAPESSSRVHGDAGPPIFRRRSIAEAARLILAGEPVAVATETVYGLAADATNARSGRAHLRSQGKPELQPVDRPRSRSAAAERIGVFDDGSAALARAHWPGPLTLVVPLRPTPASPRSSPPACRPSACACPAHPAMQALLRAVGRPLAAPSANASGSISPTRAEHVLKSLGGRLHPRLEALAELLQLGRDDRDAIGVALALAGPIILVIILGRIPFAHRLDGRHDAAAMLSLARRSPPSRLALLLLVCGKIAERYCVPTSLPWRLSWVGSWVAKKMSSRSS